MRLRGLGDGPLDVQRTSGMANWEALYPLLAPCQMSSRNTATTSRAVILHFRVYAVWMCFTPPPTSSSLVGFHNRQQRNPRRITSNQASNTTTQMPRKCFREN